MSAFCGVAARHDRPLDADVLGGALRILAPHGSAGTTTLRRSGGSTIDVVAATWSTTVERDWAERAAARERAVRVFGDVSLYNRTDLCRQLGARSTSTDLELVAAAYERWGEHAVSQLVGDFAFAVVDLRRNGTLLARDHMGSRPLVVHKAESLTTFGSSALALTGFHHIGCTLDESRVAEVLALAYGTGRTFVDGVRWVPAGTAMWLDAAGTRDWRWWDPVPLVEPRDLGSLDAHAQVLRDSLDTAVVSMLPESGTVGVSLSGGLDSASVAAAAAASPGTPPVTGWTARPPASWVPPSGLRRIADESPLVHDLAAMYPNLTPKFVESEGSHLFEFDRDLWELGAGPVRNPLNMLWGHSILQECAAEGVEVLLSGSWGNLAFSADGPGWLLDLLRHGRPVECSREASAWARRHGLPTSQVLRWSIVSAGAPVWVRRADGGGRDAATVPDYTALRPAVWEQLTNAGLLPRPADRQDLLDRTPVAARLMGAGGQAEGAAAARALWGVDQRDPTSDRRVLEASLGQPEHRRRFRGRDRAVVRHAMADRLPHSIVDQTGRGAQLPDWFERMTEARDHFAEEVDQMRDHPLTRQFVDTDRLTHLVEDWPTRTSAGDDQVIANSDYRLALARAVNVSRYVRWFEDRARRVSKGGPPVALTGQPGRTSCD